MICKAFGMASPNLAVKHYRDEQGVEHIDIDETLTAGIPASKHHRTLDWTDRQEDNALGIVTNKFRRLKPKDVEVAFLKDA